MAYRKGGTDYMGVEWNNAALFSVLNALSGKLRRELLAKATLQIAEKMHEDEVQAFRQTFSQDAYAHIFSSPQRFHAKNQPLKNTGLYVQQSFNTRDAVVSISQTYSDFRLHWFESGTENRQTRKGENRGSMLSKQGRVGFFWKTFEQKGNEYADELARIINDLIKE